MTFDGYGGIFLSYKPYREQKTGAFSALSKKQIFRIFTLKKLLFYAFCIFIHRKFKYKNAKRIQNVFPASEIAF